MRYAKISKGVVRRIWPYVKVLQDGTQILKDLPPHFRVSPRPDCIVEIEDKVEIGWIWDGTQYVPPPPPTPKKISPLEALFHVVSERMGITHAALVQEIKEVQKRQGLTPPKDKG